ncbi:interferon lambda receptor 1 [Mastacembelus armatus]|uniref:Interferon lambda receptor 1 n=1 Tax=Mastacembelus armatus TaxID=205130 RepID=A0A7N8Y1I4_9TELE|nr:uncharacterized protein LOC113136433 [Mastacembelus armatus]
MKMWSLEIIILLLFCYACPLMGNDDVYFVSKNFNNVLHWVPKKPTNAQDKVLYRVEYWSDVTEKFQIKKECHNITTLSCDLTAETLSVHDVQYRARVFVNGHFHGRTKRFKPMADTVLGPPVLSIGTNVSSLHVNVTLPLGPNGVSIAEIITNSTNGPSKSVIIYTLKITEPKWAALVNKTDTGRFVINLKNNQTKFCGHVVYKPLAEWGRSESQNTSFCVILPYDPRMLLPWLLLCAALPAAIVMTLVLYTYNYVKGGRKNSMPHSLVTGHSDTRRKVLQSPDGKLIISKPVVCTPSNQTIYTTIQPKVPTPWIGGYSPQDIPCQAWQDIIGSFVDIAAHSPTLTPQDASAQSSEIYSAVAVHVPTEENEQQCTTAERGNSNLTLTSRGEAWDGPSPILISREVPPSHDLKSFEGNLSRPLQLHTMRKTNGELVLSSLDFQVQSSTGDTPERKPLLLDLIDSQKEGPLLASLQSCDSSEWSDSGCDDNTVNTPTQPYCNTDYSPTQPVVTYLRQGCQNTPSSGGIMFDSGYKQNWMPEFLRGNAAKQL